MFLTNLTLGQFLVWFGSAAGLMVALYLLDRSRRRQVVATLQFWVAAQRAPETHHRRRIQQWPSLLLQLGALGLLLAAIAGLTLGARGPAPRHHIVILDVSAWMAARSNGRTLMDRARELALDCVRRLPARDPILLVRADALATPATGFETDRRVLESAIRNSQPGATALRLQQALAYARQVQRLRGEPGEILFIGAGRIPAEESGASLPLNLRVIAVGDRVENCGLRQVALQRAPDDPAAWAVFVSARNYGERPQRRRVLLRFGGAPAATAELHLAPGAEAHTSLTLRTRAAGWLEVRLAGSDALPADDRAWVELPPLSQVRVRVYSTEAQWFRTLLSASPWVQADFHRPSQYPAGDADLVILDGFVPREPPRVPAIWINPPLEGGPAVVRQTVDQARLMRWQSDHPVTLGIRTRDVRVDRAAVFALSEGDVALAESEAGPVIVARAGPPKALIFGFHPGRSAMRYELAAPLLFANALGWMAPGLFRRWEAQALSAGSARVDLPAEALAAVRVVREDGRPAPFTREAGGLRLFTAEPGVVRVITPSAELVYSMTLPEVADRRWEPPPQVRRGLPAPGAWEGKVVELWPWLALAGGALLLAEWLLYGRGRAYRAGGTARRGLLPWIRRSPAYGASSRWR